MQRLRMRHRAAVVAHAGRGREGRARSLSVSVVVHRASLARVFRVIRGQGLLADHHAEVAQARADPEAARIDIREGVGHARLEISNVPRTHTPLAWVPRASGRFCRRAERTWTARMPATISAVSCCSVGSRRSNALISFRKAVCVQP